MWANEVGLQTNSVRLPEPYDRKCVSWPMPLPPSLPRHCCFPSSMNRKMRLLSIQVSIIFQDQYSMISFPISWSWSKKMSCIFQLAPPWPWRLQTSHHGNIHFGKYEKGFESQGNAFTFCTMNPMSSSTICDVPLTPYGMEVLSFISRLSSNPLLHHRMWGRQLRVLKRCENFEKRHGDSIFRVKLLAHVWCFSNVWL